MIKLTLLWTYELHNHELHTMNHNMYWLAADAQSAQRTQA